MANVILLEEDSTVVEFMTDILRSAGHCIHLSGGLDDLLVRLASRVDLVISSTTLDSPVQEVISAVRVERPSTPILLTTTFLEPFEERLLLEMGADAVLHKPFDLPTFLCLVGHLASNQTRRSIPR